MDIEEGELVPPLLNSTAKLGVQRKPSSSSLTSAQTSDVTRRYLVAVLGSDEKGDERRESYGEAQPKKSVQKEERRGRVPSLALDNLSFSTSNPGARQLPLSFLYPGNVQRQSRLTFRARGSIATSESQSTPRGPHSTPTGKVHPHGPGPKTANFPGFSRTNPMLSTSTIRPDTAAEGLLLSGVSPFQYLPPQVSILSDSPAVPPMVSFPSWNASVVGPGGSACSGAGGGGVGAAKGTSLRSASPSGGGEMPSGMFSVQSNCGTGAGRSQLPTISIGASGSSLSDKRPQSSSAKVVEELNLNPFTAAYRNFTESSLMDIFELLCTMGNEIEQFAYTKMVDRYYNNNGLEGVTSSFESFANASHGLSPKRTLPAGIPRFSLSGILPDDGNLGATGRTDIAESSPAGYCLMIPSPCMHTSPGGGLLNSDLSLGNPFVEVVKPFPSDGGGEKEGGVGGPERRARDTLVSHSPDLLKQEKESTEYSFPISGDQSDSNERDTRIPLDGGRSHTELSVATMDQNTKHMTPFQTQYPLCAESNNFLYTDDWFEDFPLPFAQDGAKVALTTEPPLFFCGMLLDPVTEKYLFGGAAFYEECRVLRVPIDPCNEFMNLVKEKTGLFKASGEGLVPEKSSQRSNARILLREYVSLKRADHGFIVQTFSVLDSNCRIDSRRNHLVPPTTARSLLDRVRAGALTRAFALQQVVTFKAVRRGSNIEERIKSVSNNSSLPSLENGDSLLPTLFFTRNVIPRFFRNPLRKLWKRNRSSAMPVSKCRFRKDLSRPMEEETFFLSQDISLRPTADLEMQQNAPMYMKAIDHIKAYLNFFKDSFSFVTMVRIFFLSVRRVQHFFRHCLAKKQRAMTKMVWLWRHLEVECKVKLHHYHPFPSSMERVDMIAANLLVPQMITTREYKEKLIRELWEKQRQDYKKWKKEYHEDEFLKKTGVSMLAETEKTYRVIPRLPSSQIRSATPFSDVELALEKALEALQQTNSAEETEEELEAKDEGTDFTFQQVDTNIFHASSKCESTVAEGRRSTVEDIQKNRMKDEMHRLFGWYIEPEKLLYESHHRLLTSLKESVLTMEEVRLEIQRLSLERAEHRKENFVGVVTLGDL